MSSEHGCERHASFLTVDSRASLLGMPRVLTIRSTSQETTSGYNVCPTNSRDRALLPLDYGHLYVSTPSSSS
jgi:hypothetical protein